MKFIAMINRPGVTDIGEKCKEDGGMFNTYAGAFAVRPDTFEYVLISMSVVAVLGGLAWVVQALNGARLAPTLDDRRVILVDDNLLGATKL